MRHKRFLIVIMLGFLIPITLTECPRLCECKWKSGKESVVCINANLTVVPQKLDSGTQILDLTGNNLSFIRNEEFSKAGLVNIQKLYLAKCRLKSIDRYAFNNLINLIELDLSSNLLTSVPSHVFESTPELRDLKLSSNPIHRIPNDAFVHTPQLIRLEISNCKISSIEWRAFHGLEKSLEWLKLDRNKLSDVRTSSFTMFQNLHGLELSGNPWNCSCSLRHFREWMLQKNVPYDIPPTCAYPKRLLDRSWDKLHLDDFACVPEIFAYESKTYGVEGKNVTMTCRINSVPEPSVKWLIKNKVITNISGSTFGKKMYFMHLTNESSELTISSADLQDTGIYVCAAENKAGKAEASVTLAISKHGDDTDLTKKVLLASIVVGVVLTLSICAMGVCFCKTQKRYFLVWKTRDECDRVDNYEKIELNQKLNGGVRNREDSNSLTSSCKKNGDYRVVPGSETDHDEEDESTLEVTTPSTSASRKVTLDDLKPNRTHLKDAVNTVLTSEDCENFRDNIRRTHSSTFGTSKTPATTTISPSNLFCTSLRFCQTTNSSTTLISPPLSTVHAGHEASNTSSLKIISTSYHPNENSFFTTVVNNSNKIPDILNIYGNPTANKSSSFSENGSYQNVNEIFCTLPRKKRSSKYTSNESQTALLDSRYNSSGGESGSSLMSGSRRMSVECQRQDIANFNHRVNRLSGSFLNLAKEDVCSTPLLDINNLESRLMYKGTKFANTSSKPPNPYDYHAAQLERFLEEYRVLQKQLTEMKETCDSIVQAKSAKKDVSPSISSNEVCNTPNSTKSLKEAIDQRYHSEESKYLLANSPSTRNIRSKMIPNS